MNKFYPKNNRRFPVPGILFLAVLAGAISGCKSFQPLSRPEGFPLPDRFSAQADTQSIADLPWKVFLQDAHLKNLIDSALKNNLDLQMALQNIEIAAAGYQQTAGALRPSVSAVGAVSSEKYGAQTLEGKTNNRTRLTTEYFLGLQSSWEIDLWNRLHNKRKAAYLRLLASESGIQLVRTLLVSEIAKRYYNLIALDHKLAITRKNIDLQQSALDIVTVQKEAGRATELAVQQFRAQLLNTRALEAGFQKEITAIENGINMLARRAPQRIQRADSLPDPANIRAIATGVPSGLLLRRPDIRQAELEIEASKADLAVARAAFFPTLTLTPFAGFNPYNLTKLVNPASLALGLAGGLTAPVLNKAAIKSDYRKSTALSQKAYLQYQHVVSNSFYEVMNQLNELNNSKKVYVLKQQEAAALNNATSISRDLYLAGYASYLEVILAQRNVLQVELDAVANRNHVFTAYIDLYRSLGGGW